METRSRMSRSLHTNRDFEKLEPYEGKPSRTVLRGEEGSNALDLPDRPADMEQRNGRAVRKGNTVKLWGGNVVDIVIYGTEKTLDAYKFNLLKNKQMFINQINNGTIAVRRIDEGGMDEDSGMNFAEFVAILSGNNDLLNKTKLDNKIMQLEKEQAIFKKERIRAERKIAACQEEVEKAKRTEADFKRDLEYITTMEQLQDLDNTIFADHISNELKQNFDRLDLRRNYSLLVVPGYIGSNAILDKWSKMAYENKVFLVTDFQDLETPDDVVDIFFNANHTSGDVFKSNTIMTCNWLLGRQREESVGEEENLYIPPSSSLAGKIYNTLMSQVVAGKKFGGLNEVESVRFDLRKSEISELERMGLVPMVNEYSKVMAFSAKTLFNGDNLGLQTYSVVRVFDYITKVLIDFLNRRAFENWTTRTEADLRGQVVKFLDSVMGPNKLIERFKVMKIEQDPNQKDRVLLDIHITPYFPAKSFVIQLAGHKGDNPEDAIWESEYHQE